MTAINFEGKHIYCPWSLMNFCREAQYQNKSPPAPYWINTSGNDIISLFAKNSISNQVE